MPTSIKYSPDEIWKERLGFTSGAIVIWGLFLLKLWPFVSHFQIGNPPVALTLLYYSGQEIPEYNAFLYMVLLLTLGVWTVLLAILHVLSRGLWLAIANETNLSPSSLTVRRVLNSIASETYLGVFIIGAIIIVLICLGGFISIVFFVIQALLINNLHLTTELSNVIAGIFSIVFIFMLVVGIVNKLYALLHTQNPTVAKKGHNKRINALRANLQRLKVAVLGRTRIQKYARFLVILLFGLSYYVVGQAACTVELNLNKKLYYQSQDMTAELYLSLGGSTGSPKEVTGRLWDSGQSLIKDLVLEDISGGQYISVIPLAGLGPGIYEVVVNYNHTSLDFSSPFLHLAIKKSQKFVIVGSP